VDKIKVLLVEDEMVLASVLKETLEPKGFSFAHASDGQTAWALFHSFQPDICVLDIMLPRKNGLELARDIRLVNEDVPIIFLTAKTATSDVLVGLETGADDYLKKPFSIEELHLRLLALVRRNRKQGLSSDLPSVISLGSYRFHALLQELHYEEEKIALSYREAELLKVLLQHQNSVAPRKDVLLKIWGDESFFHARNMDVYITRLRKHLSRDTRIQIVNVRGVGYKLVIGH